MPKMGRMHGESGYQNGCRCPICSADHSLKMRAQRAKKKGDWSLYASLVRERVARAADSAPSLDRPAPIRPSRDASVPIGGVSGEPSTSEALEAFTMAVEKARTNPNDVVILRSDNGTADELELLAESYPDDRLCYERSGNQVSLWLEDEPTPVHEPERPAIAEDVSHTESIREVLAREREQKRAVDRQLAAVARQRDLIARNARR